MLCRYTHTHTHTHTHVCLCLPACLFPQTSSLPVCSVRPIEHTQANTETERERRAKADATSEIRPAGTVASACRYELQRCVIVCVCVCVCCVPAGCSDAAACCAVCGRYGRCRQWPTLYTASTACEALDTRGGHAYARAHTHTHTQARLTHSMLQTSHAPRACGMEEASNQLLVSGSVTCNCQACCACTLRRVVACAAGTACVL